MRSIYARLKRFQYKNPLLAAYPCLCMAVEGQAFTRKALKNAFKNHVSEDDYEPSDKKALIDHLEDVTQCSRTSK